MENVTIRPAAATDLSDIYSFVCALEEQVSDRDAFAKCYEVCLAGAHHHYLIATMDDKAIGYISCHGQVLLHHCGMVYEIQELYVADAYRSMGIGRKLLTALEDALSKEKYELLEVASNMRRVDAHRFYRSNGFEHTTYKFKKVRRS